MTPICSIDMSREIERRWHQRSAAPPVPLNDNAAGGGRCPACGGPAAFAPQTSEYRGRGTVHHHWRCARCGHEWITASHVAT